LARGVVWWNHSAGRGERLQSSTAAEQKQHLLIHHPEHAEPLTGFEQLQSELVLVKANRAGKIVRVEAGFNDAVNAWGGHHRFSV